MKTTLSLRAPWSRRCISSVAAACLGLVMTAPASAQCMSGGGTAAAAGTTTAATAAPAFTSFAAPPVLQLQLQAAPQPSAQQQALLQQQAVARQQAFARQMAVERQQTLASMQARSATEARPPSETVELSVPLSPQSRKAVARTEPTSAQRAATLRYWQTAADARSRFKK